MELLDYEAAKPEVKLRLVSVARLPFKNSIYSLLSKEKSKPATNKAYSPKCLYVKKIGNGKKRLLFFDKKENDKFKNLKNKNCSEMLDIIYQLSEIRGAKAKIAKKLVENGLANSFSSAMQYLYGNSFGMENRNNLIKEIAFREWRIQ